MYGPQAPEARTRTPLWHSCPALSHNSRSSRRHRIVAHTSDMSRAAVGARRRRSRKRTRHHYRRPRPPPAHPCRYLRRPRTANTAAPLPGRQHRRSWIDPPTRARKPSSHRQLPVTDRIRLAVAQPRRRRASLTNRAPTAQGRNQTRQHLAKVSAKHTTSYLA